MGSETVAAGEEKTDEPDFLADLILLRPQRQMKATVRSTPTSRPEKKPTRTPTGVKLLQLAAVVVVF